MNIGGPFVISATKMCVSSCVMLTYCAMLICLLVGHTDGRCRLPSEWHGRWYWKQTEVNITASHVGSRGRCLQRESVKHLLLTERDGKRCYICMVIFYQHRNIIEFKESMYCAERRRPLRVLCNEISGDAPLHTMVRVLVDGEEGGAVAEPCPFSGQFRFQYQRHRQPACMDPVSRLSSCDGKHSGQLQLLYQACVDVGGSEQLSERLTCLATWTSFRRRYMFARLDSVKTHTDADRYRCYLYKKVAPGQYDMIQSEDSTCQGLQSLNEAYKVFHLRTESLNVLKCLLPEWLTGVRYWSSMDGTLQYRMSDSNYTFTIHSTSGSEDDDDSPIRLLCVGMTPQHHQHSLQLVMLRRRSCLEGYQCVKIERRHKNVIQMKFGRLTYSPKTACEHFDDSRKFITLLADESSIDQHQCPLYGRFSVLSALSHDMSQCHSDTQYSVQAGCDGAASVTVSSRCGRQTHLNTEYKCFGEWRHSNSGDTFIAVKSSSSHKHGDQWQCLVVSSLSTQPATNITTTTAAATTHEWPQHILSLQLWPHDCGGVQWWRQAAATSSGHHVTSPVEVTTRPVWALNVSLQGKCSQPLMSATSGGRMLVACGGTLLTTIFTLLVFSLARHFSHALPTGTHTAV